MPLNSIVSIIFLYSLLQSSCYASAKQASYTDSTVRISTLREDLIRLEYSPSGNFLDAPSYFASQRANPIIANWRIEDGAVVIDTKLIQLRYQSNGRAFSSENLEIRSLDGQWSWVPGKKAAANLNGPIASLDRVSGPVALPEGLLARDGWHLIDDSNSHIFTGQWIEKRPVEEGRQDWYFFGYGKDFKGALKALAHVSGKVPLPRRYALGSWYSRYWPYTSDDFLAIVEEYKENSFPLDVMVLDMDWHHGFGKRLWTGYTWNTDLIPNPERLLSSLHDNGVAVCLNDHPAEGVQFGEDSYAAFMASMGRAENTKETIAFDSGSEFYMKNFWQATHSPHDSIGVDFWWLDWQQYPFTLSIPDLRNLAWLNHFYFERSQDKNERGLSFSRWGGWGDHRHPIHFSGDTGITWAALNFEIKFNALSSNSGLFYWSHDIGGHFGQRDGEMVARWTQFGATSPTLRLHSNRDKHLDRRPWTYDPRIKAAMGKAFLLRTQLFPYIYTSAYQAYEQMLPLNRPLYLEHPEQEAAYAAADQFYLGDHIIVAPIAKPGVGANLVATRRVWIPASDSGSPDVWYDWYTHRRFQPGYHVVGASIDEFPVFVRGGAVIPLQNRPNEHIANGNYEDLRLLVFPGLDGKPYHSFLYEDDGKSKNYESGAFAKSKFTYFKNGSVVSVSIGEVNGSYEGKKERRSYTIELPETEAIRNLTPKLPFSYDEASKTSTVFVSDMNAADHIDLTIEFEKEEPAERAELYRARLLTLLDPRLSEVHSLAELAAIAEGLPPQALLEALGIFGVQIEYHRNKQLSIIQASQAPLGEIQARVLDRLGPHDIIESDTLCRASRCDLDLPVWGHNSKLVGQDRLRVIELAIGNNGEQCNFKIQIDKIEPTIGSWMISEAYPFDIKKPLSTQIYEPEIAGTSDWQAVNADICSGIVDIRKVLNFDLHLAYLRNYVYLEQDMDVEFSVRSDDGVAVIVDNRTVHENNVARAITDSCDSFRVSLKAGKHAIVAKVSNHWGQWALQMSLKAPGLITVSAQ